MTGGAVLEVVEFVGERAKRRLAVFNKTLKRYERRYLTTCWQPF
jgi:hypothetical protein